MKNLFRVLLAEVQGVKGGLELRGKNRNTGKTEIMMVHRSRLRVREQVQESQNLVSSQTFGLMENTGFINLV